MTADSLTIPTDSRQGYLLSSDNQGNASWQQLTVEGILSSMPYLDFSCLKIESSLGIGPYPFSVAAQNQFVYVVDFDSDDLKVIDARDPVNPVVSGTLAIGSGPVSIAVSGIHAYVVDAYTQDLKIIDVSDPANPVLRNSIGVGTFPRSVAVSGNYAYIVHAVSMDLRIIDVTDPALPRLTGSMILGSNPQAITVKDNYAYIIDSGSDDLKIVDVSNPSSPALAGNIGIGSSPQAVSVFDNFVYIVDSDSDDLRIIDVSSTTTPMLRGSLGISSYPVAVHVSGNYGFIADSDSDDLKVIDISNPSAPIMKDSIELGPYPISLAISDNYAYVVDEPSDDLKVIQLSCPVMITVNADGKSFSTVSDADNDPANELDSKWIMSGNDIYNINPGNIGIGIQVPNHPLELASGAHVTPSGVWVSSSDRSKKSQLEILNYGLREIQALKPVRYRYKIDNSKNIGFVAQELESVIPEIVSGQKGNKGIAYGLLTTVLVNAVQELSDQVKQQRIIIEILKEENSTLLDAIGEIQEKITVLEHQIDDSRN
jgi:hypothetical protein